MALEINLSGKVALVTGVSNGIGAGVARILMKAGANVAGCGRSGEVSDGARDFVLQAEKAGVKALYRRTDVTQLPELEQLVAAAVERFGRLDLLVSNAGVNVFRVADVCSEGDWQHNLDLNLASHWRLARLCLPHLEKNRGVIQIMTSNHAYATIPGCFPYNVTKTALTGLVRALAIDWGPKVRVVGLAPGFVDTPGNEAWFASHPDAEAERRRTIAMHPAGRLGTCDEIGAWCAFLASDLASFATGCTYVIDGGRLAMLQDAPGE